MLCIVGAASGHICMWVHRYMFYTFYYYLLINILRDYQVLFFFILRSPWWIKAEDRDQGVDDQERIIADAYLLKLKGSSQPKVIWSVAIKASICVFGDSVDSVAIKGLLYVLG